MEAIILFSHGSTLCGAGENLKAIAAQLKQRGEAPIVEPGYLNYSEPLFEAAFENCVAQGATSVTIVPYFLAAGYFVKVSLPPKIQAMQEKFPGVAVRVTDAIRFHSSLADALVACAEKAQPPAAWRDILNRAPQWCRNNSECPLHGTPQCPATSGAA